MRASCAFILKLKHNRASMKRYVVFLFTYFANRTNVRSLQRNSEQNSVKTKAGTVSTQFLLSDGVDLPVT